MSNLSSLLFSRFQAQDEEEWDDHDVCSFLWAVEQMASLVGLDPARIVSLLTKWGEESYVRRPALCILGRYPDQALAPHAGTMTRYWRRMEVWAHGDPDLGPEMPDADLLV